MDCQVKNACHICDRRFYVVLLATSILCRSVFDPSNGKMNLENTFHFLLFLKNRHGSSL